MAKKTKREDTSAYAVDFSDTDSRGGKKGAGRSAHVPEGDYLVKCTAAKWDKSSDKETPGIFVDYQIVEPKKFKGKVIRDRLWVSEKALWRLRQTLEAMGIDVPSKKVKVDPKKMIGKICGVSVEDDEYDNKVRSNVTDTFLKTEYSKLNDDDEAEDDEAEDEADEADEDEDEESEDEDEDSESDEDEDEDEDDDLEAIDL